MRTAAGGGGVSAEAGIRAVRTALVEAYRRLEEIEGCVEGKSGEMRVEVSYPTWWDVQDGVDPMEPSGLMVYSYALGPSRSHYFLRAKKEAHPNYYTWEGPDPFAIAERVIRQEWWPTADEPDEPPAPPDSAVLPTPTEPGPEAEEASHG